MAVRPHSSRRTSINIDLEFHPEVRMLNGSGPLTSPPRILYVDGSPESFAVFQLCENLGVAVALEVAEPGTGVVLYDRLFHERYQGMKEIRPTLEFVQDLHKRVTPLIEQAMPPAMQRRAGEKDSSIVRALENESEERHKLMQSAVRAYGSQGQ